MRPEPIHFRNGAKHGSIAPDGYLDSITGGIYRRYQSRRIKRSVIFPPGRSDPIQALARLANSMKSMLVTFLTAVLGLAAPARLWGADESLFREKVAPVLETRCIRCHGEVSSKGDLNLATVAGVLKGGKGGLAVIPHKPDESVLLDKITGDPPEMPLKEKPLSRQEVAGIRAWIDAGALWPRGLVLRDRHLEGRRWWAFEPLERPRVPPIHNRSWARTPIDAFVLFELEKRRLSPSPEADRRTLIRRLSSDLLGLPPAPVEIDAFVGDLSPTAYESLVDRLLASAHYGERWGRHWLDVVHYGDTHGYDKDKRRDHAWPYRDYVIGSFNADVPYSQFIREQVAGDVIWPGDPKGIIATGFIAAGPWDFVGHVELREGTVDKLKTRVLDRDDMVSSTMATFVSMTAHCARCHDHKFDPITQTDYYRLQAVFAGVDRGDRSYQTHEQSRRRLVLEGRREAVRAHARQIQQKIYQIVHAERKRQRSADAITDPTLRRERDATAAELKQIDAQIRSHPTGEMVYSALPHAPRPIAVLRRGDVEQPGETVGPGSLACLSSLPATFVLTRPDDEGSRRAALADWIASPRNVLAWRSIANRVWHYHFGRGIVETPNDFGRNGAPPSHPELLDWLAAELRDHGQSIKALHRLIVCSAVYRQLSTGNPAAERIDVDNRYLWRQNRRRLDAESVRDGVLAVSGTLDQRMGGAGFELFQFKDDHSPVYDHSAPDKVDNPQVRRRSVYRFVVRSVPNPFMEALDCADPNLNTPVRSQTLTALQALALWNDLFIVRQSREFAGCLERTESDPRARLVAAYRRALGRKPAAQELDALAAYAAKHGLASACLLLWNTNEFVFID